MPSLDLTFLVPKPNGPLQLTVRNLGGGVAKTPCVMLVVRDSMAMNYVGDGALPPGQGVKITVPGVNAASLKQSEYMAVAGCRDIDNVFHAWSSGWEERTFRDWRCRPVRKLDWGTAFRKFYPDVDVTALPQLRCNIESLW